MQTKTYTPNIQTWNHKARRPYTNSHTLNITRLVSHATLQKNIWQHTKVLAHLKPMYMYNTQTICCRPNVSDALLSFELFVVYWTNNAIENHSHKSCEMIY